MQASVCDQSCRPSAKKTALTVLLMMLPVYAILLVINRSLDLDLKELMHEDTVRRSQHSRKGSVVKHFKGIAADDPELTEYVREKMLIPPSTKPYNLNHPQTIDASQFGQTKDLDRLLRNMTSGFFVEVGAHDGEQLSNSLYFERFRNWTGMLIEANPEVFKRLETKNRKAYSINACLSLTPSAEMLHFVPNDFLGRLAPDGHQSGVNLQCVPLYTLMLALDRSQIDLFSLDIEGDELKVLKTIPWDKMQIRLMIVEVNHIQEGKEAVIKYMESVGYTFLKAHEIDLIFAKKDLLDKAGH